MSLNDYGRTNFYSNVLAEAVRVFDEDMGCELNADIEGGEVEVAHAIAHGSRSELVEAIVAAKPGIVNGQGHKDVSGFAASVIAQAEEVGATQSEAVKGLVASVKSFAHL